MGTLYTCYARNCTSWRGVNNTINSVFQVNNPLDPKPCILGIFDDLVEEDNPKQAIAQALFQAHKLIPRGWKVTEPPTLKEWITQMGATLRLEKYIFKHWSRPGKFDRLWSSWLNTPGLSPVDLILDRLFH